MQAHSARDESGAQLATRIVQRLVHGVAAHAVVGRDEEEIGRTECSDDPREPRIEPLQVGRQLVQKVAAAAALRPYPRWSMPVF